MKNITIILVVSFLELQPILKAQTVKFPDGTLRDATNEDFSVKNYKSKYYNELYTYHIQLDNGVQIIYTFSINDFGSLKERVTGAKLSVTWKDGITYIINKEYPIQKLINNPEINQIQLHPERNYWAKGSLDDTHNLMFKTTKNGISYYLDLDLTKIAVGKIWGDGVYKIGKFEFGLSFLIPYSDVSGKIAINGDTLIAKGYAYMDHMYQNNLSTDFINKSYRLQSGDSQDGMIMHLITVEKDYYNKPLGYGILFTNRKATLLTPSEIEIINSKKSHGVALDTQLIIDLYQIPVLSVSVTDLFKSYSILDELSGLKRYFAKQFIGGEVVEMNGNALINEKKVAHFYYMVVDK